jgi:hypothetical protein
MSEIAPNVLLVFYSRYGAAEQLALAAGVGALQARSNIRLRRLPDLADARTIESDQAWRDNLARMQRDYVAPRPADPLWADVVVLAVPAGPSGEAEAYLASLAEGGSMTGKILIPLAVDGNPAALAPLTAAAEAAGFRVAPLSTNSGDALVDAREHGRRVAEEARARTRGSAGA